MVDKQAVKSAVRCYKQQKINETLMKQQQMISPADIQPAQTAGSVPMPGPQR